MFEPRPQAQRKNYGPSPNSDAYTSETLEKYKPFPHKLINLQINFRYRQINISGISQVNGLNLEALITLHIAHAHALCTCILHMHFVQQLLVWDLGKRLQKMQIHLIYWFPLST